ncbi:MAG: Gfo/Idh/MocA family protein, partial [Armatimonadota bacterium]
MDKVRIGFVGVGSMGQCAHLKNYVTLPDCEVVAIAEIREKLGQRVAARYGVPRVYKDHEAMLAAEKLDGIVASQPFNRHATLIPELYKARVPVFTEKPLAATVENGERILAALKASGTWHMVGYHKRSDPAIIYAKREIDRLKSTGELGRMRYVRILMPAGEWTASGFIDLIRTDEPMPPLEWDPPAPDMDKETFDRYKSFVNYYVHQVNLMRYLMGEPYKVTFADPMGIVMAVQSESGIAGIIEMTPYQTTLDWQEQALVCFEKGYIKIDLPVPLAINRPGRVEIMCDPGDGKTPETIVPTLPWVHAMRQQAINFVSAIKGECKPP